MKKSPSCRMESVNIIRSVQHGVGVIQLHKVVDQTQDLTKISTAPNPIGHTKVNGTYRRRFGNVIQQKNTEFDYPRGAPGVYAQSTPGTAGMGNLGDASYNSGGHDSVFKPAADLLEAQGVVSRDVHMDTHFAAPERYHYEDKAKHAIAEGLQERAEIHQENKIRDLLAKGFTEQEIAKKIESDREKAIEKAEKLPVDSRRMMAAAIAKQMPAELRSDLASPGGIPAPRDTTAFQRATDSSTLVNRKKKFQAMNRAMRISGEVSQVEEPRRDAEMEEKQTAEQVIARVAREHASEKAKVHELDQRAREQQQMIEAEEAQKEEAMAKAMPGIQLTGRKARIPKPLPEGAQKIAPRGGGRGRPKVVLGSIASIEDVQALATREQMPLSAFMQLPGMMKQEAGAGLGGVEAEHMAARQKKAMF